MEYSRKYKKLEKIAAASVTAFAKKMVNTLIAFLKDAVIFLDRKITVMIVPHSNNSVFSFQTNTLAMVSSCVLFVGFFLSFLYFNMQAASSSLEISHLQSENRQTIASLDELREENSNLLQAAKRFQSSLSLSLALIGVNAPDGESESVSREGDLASLFASGSLESNTREVQDIKKLTNYMEDVIQPVEQIAKMLEFQGTLLSDIPSIWPLQNGIGHRSMSFGQNIHPITGQWYIHKGVDFSTYRAGDPVVATANGQIVTVGYDSGFGNYIILKHKHGIYTRYAHMSAFKAQRGQFVTQGQIIGWVGNTGISTGPHLHYEVHIGSDVVDPEKYINIKLKH
ncbi:MAG: M23 family metallopeptidase [Treponemataceae bacterium]|nr:MAG: M23 family metallopeptidase [Treponemataceae bacterium]